jgi:hypothetical protein
MKPTLGLEAIWAQFPLVLLEQDLFQRYIRTRQLPCDLFRVPRLVATEFVERCVPFCASTMDTTRTKMTTFWDIAP